MKRWHETDSVAVLAIVGGALVGVWLLGTAPVVLLHVVHEQPVDVPNCGCSPEPAESRAAEGVLFHASSLASGFSVRGDYAGRMVLDGGRVHATIPHALLTRMSDRPEGERLVSVRLGLAEGDGSGSWNVVSEGPSQRVDGLAEGEERVLEGLELTVPVTSVGSCAWLVVIHELEYRDADGRMQPAWTYAHSDPESLAELTGSEADCPGG